MLFSGNVVVDRYKHKFHNRVILFVIFCEELKRDVRQWFRLGDCVERFILFYADGMMKEERFCWVDFSVGILSSKTHVDYLALPNERRLSVIEITRSFCWELITFQGALSNAHSFESRQLCSSHITAHCLSYYQHHLPCSFHASVKYMRGTISQLQGQKSTDVANK